MPLNIHPIFTHFPVALLTLYSLFELIRFKKITDQPYWFYIKACFVIIGTLSGYAAYTTGELLEDAFGGQLIEVHSFFASITLAIFAVISVAYLISWVEKTDLAAKIASSRFSAIWKVLVMFRATLMRPLVSIIAAFLGLIAITVTGALGGALAYGPDVDPIVHFIYSLLIKQ